MKIGKLTLTTGKVDPDLLVASAGVTPDRMAAMLQGPCIASTVADALLACCRSKEPPDRAELARTISAAGVDKVRARVAQLYRTRTHDKTAV